MHVAWTETDGVGGRVRHAIVADGTVGPVVMLATGLAGTESDVGAIAPLAWMPGAGRVAVVWRQADGLLYERRIDRDGVLTPAAVVSPLAVVQNAVDSDQVGADTFVRDDRLHVVFIGEDSRSIYHAESAAAGDWSEPVVAVAGIDGQWVRGRLVTRADGTEVYGYVYDAGSNGGSGMNRYAEID